MYTKDILKVICENDDYDQALEIIEPPYSVKALPKFLYKYISLNETKENENQEKINTLHNKKVFLSGMGGFNDPFDDKAHYFDKHNVESYATKLEMEWKLDNMYVDFKRVACFTELGINNMPMWSHYANNHHGFCVKYSCDDNAELVKWIQKVNYVDKRIELTDIIKILLDKTKNSKSTEYLEKSLELISLDLSLWKHLTWSYEKEYRCVCPKELPGMPYIQAIPESVYVGLNCSKEEIDKIRSVANALNIRVFQMQFDINAPQYELTKKEI